jgi:hypothetical protein
VKSVNRLMSACRIVTGKWFQRGGRTATGGFVDDQLQADDPANPD